MPAANFIPDMLRLLSDVSIVAPSNGQALLHNGTTWANRAITTDDVSGLSGMLASYATKSGGNSLSGDQTLASGSSFLATNGGDWNGVAITGTGLVGKSTSNTQTWSIASETGVITGVGSGLSSIPNSATTATSANTASAIVARDASGGFSGGNIRGTRYQSVNGNFDWQDATLTLSAFIIRSQYLRHTSGVYIGDDNYSNTTTSVTLGNGTRSNSSGVATAVNINPTDSTTGSGGLTALQTQISGSGSGSGSKLHYVAKNAAGTTVASIDSSGNFVGQRYTAGSCALGTNDVIVPQVTSTGNNVSLNLQGRSFSAAGNAVTVMNGASVTNSSGTVAAFSILPTDSTTGTGGLTALKVNLAGTGTGSGAKLLADFQTAGTSKFSVNSAGALTGTGSFGGVALGNVGGTAGYVAHLGCHPFSNGTLYASGGMQLAGDVYISTNSASVSMGSTKDTGITRNAAGVLEINNGTPGTYRDLIARSVQVENGQYFKAKRLTGGGVIDAIGFPASSNILTIRGGNNLLADTSIQMVNSSGTALMTLTGDGNIGFKTTAQFGSGVGVIGIANATTAPTIAPIGGGVYWVEAGALKYMGSSGTITTLAAA